MISIGGFMKVNYAYLAFMLAFFGSSPLAGNEQKKDSSWTWLYYKMIDHAQENMGKRELHFVKEDIPLFTQLIFSWNAKRPSKGHYSFWVSARDAKTKQWGSWHRMIDWGAGVQRSYLSKSSDSFSHYQHVRLEIADNTHADAFRVRIQAHDAADFLNVHAFAVSTSNFNDFQSEDLSELTKLGSVMVDGVPKLSQFLLDHPKNDSLCSPTSTTMLSSFLCGKQIDPLEFADQAYDEGLGVFGSWPFNTAHAFEQCRGSFLFFTARLNSFARLHQRLQQGLPVVVSVRGPLEGAALPYKNGHLIVVVGWDAKKQEVICHDPAFKKLKEVTRRYSAREFMQAWERSKRLAYIAEPRER